jgi:hypothetical protein
MKRKILFTAALITGMIITFNINVVERESGDISLQNIEILSFGETGKDISCLYTGSIDCPKNGVKVAFVW